MVSPGYSVHLADVIRVTERIVVFVPQEGPKKGQEVVCPRSLFEDPEFVDRGDDEIVLASWWATKEGLV